MKWIKIAIKTTTNAVDFISGLFDELGLEGIQIEDNVPISTEEKQAMFIEIQPELESILERDDGCAIVSSYINMEWDLEDLIGSIGKGLDSISELVDIGEGRITIEEVDDEDWIHNWKEFFKPFRVAENIVIKPTWEELEERNEKDYIIEIDPGTVFGTGAHETTKLCITQLCKYITKETKFLDIGCGSGILSIICLKLGAKHGVLTDIDPAALIVARENLKVNLIEEDAFQILEGDMIQDETLQEAAKIEECDIVVANILADVIIPLSEEIGSHLKSGGLFIVSGIINTKKEEVEQALLLNGFEIVEINEMKDWVSFTCRC